MHFPTWVDLKGQDAVPETVHHVVRSWGSELDLSSGDLLPLPLLLLLFLLLLLLLLLLLRCATLTPSWTLHGTN